MLGVEGLEGEFEFGFFLFFKDVVSVEVVIVDWSFEDLNEVDEVVVNVVCLLWCGVYWLFVDFDLSWDDLYV